jgi:hypothetical protein
VPYTPFPEPADLSGRLFVAAHVLEFRIGQKQRRRIAIRPLAHDSRRVRVSGKRTIPSAHSSIASGETKIRPSGALIQTMPSSHMPFDRLASIAFAEYPDNSAAFLIVTHFIIDMLRPACSDRQIKGRPATAPKTIKNGA